MFSDEGSYIYNRHTESCIPILRENGSYKLDFWVEDPDPFQSLTGNLANVIETTQNTSDIARYTTVRMKRTIRVLPGFPFLGNKTVPSVEKLQNALGQ